MATKNNEPHIIECKFHSDQGLNCNAKVPLYINSIFRGVKENWGINPKNINTLSQDWLERNMRLTENILIYGNCIGLYLLSWDYPKNNGLKDRIERLRLYPITVSTLLTKREKQFLLSTNMVLYRELIGNVFYLDHLDVSDTRKQKNY